MHIASIYKSLRKNAKGIVTSFKSDWRHDRAHLRSLHSTFKDNQLERIEFIHVSRPTGTHMWPIYRHQLDTVRPYLFGSCTPRKTLRDLADMFSPSSKTFAGDEIVQHYNGSSLKLISHDVAHELFKSAANAKSQPVSTT